MPIFRATIAGRKSPILMSAETSTKAIADLVTVKALTAKELAAAFGEPLWKAGDPLPAEPAVETADEKPETETE